MPSLYFTEIVPTSDIGMAFKDIDVGVLVGAMPRREGMERKDLLKANVKIFKQQGQALDQFAKKNVKVRPGGIVTRFIRSIISHSCTVTILVLC